MNDQKSKSGCVLGELAVGWALHALEPAEESLVAVHLVDCAQCARIVAETEQVGVTLGLSIPEVTPSAELEQRILTLTATPQASPVMSLAPPPRPAPPDIAPEVTGGSPRTLATPWRQAPRRRHGRQPICWSDALLVLSVVLLAMAAAVAIVFILI